MLLSSFMTLYSIVGEHSLYPSLADLSLGRRHLKRWRQSFETRPDRTLGARFRVGGLISFFFFQNARRRSDSIPVRWILVLYFL